MGSRRVDRPEATSPLRPAAKTILRTRMRSVIRLVKDVSAGRIHRPEYIHQLRVAIRRAEAAISAFEPELDVKATVRARRRLRSVRKAAGAVRDCDVHKTLLGSFDSLRSDEMAPVATYLRRRLNAARRKAAEEVLDVAKRRRVRKLKKARRALLDIKRRQGSHPASPPPPPTLLGAALRTFSNVCSAARESASRDLGSLENLHQLRVSAKQVRYAVEIFRACVPDSLCDSTLTHLREFQAVLGRVNDARQMSTWLADEARYLARAARPKRIPRGSTPDGIHEELRVLVGWIEADLAAAQQAALPQIAERLEIALGALEAWVASSGAARPAEAVEPKSPAGRRAEGTLDRSHATEPRRGTVGQPA